MKKFFALLTVAVLLLALVPGAAFAAATNVATQAELVAALAPSAAVNITASFVWDGTTIAIPEGATVTASAGVTISVSGTDYLFTMGAGSTLDGLRIVKTDTAGAHNIVLVNAGCTVKNCRFSGQFGYTAGYDSDHVSRAMEVSGGSGITISGNTISHLRQPAYINAATGTVSNNHVEYTKGWVICNDSDMNFTGNTFSNNVVDFAIIQNTGEGGVPVPGSNYANRLVAMSRNNGGAYVVDQIDHASVKNGVFFVSNADEHATLNGASERAQSGDVIAVNENYAMPSGGGMIMPGTTLRIAGGATLALNGRLTNRGTIENYGIIAGDGYIENMGTIYTNRDREGSVENIQGGSVVYFEDLKTYYQITIVTGKGGISSPSNPTFAEAGKDSMVINFIPNAGYAVRDVLVDGVSVGAVKSYQFKNVMKDHKIEVIFTDSAVKPPQTGAASMIGAAILCVLGAAGSLCAAKKNKKN